jgi:hypothetical protein
MENLPVPVYSSTSYSSHIEALYKKLIIRRWF